MPVPETSEILEDDAELTIVHDSSEHSNRKTDNHQLESGYTANRNNHNHHKQENELYNTNGTELKQQLLNKKQLTPPHVSDENQKEEEEEEDTEEDEDTEDRWSDEESDEFMQGKWAHVTEFRNNTDNSNTRATVLNTNIHRPTSLALLNVSSNEGVNVTTLKQLEREEDHENNSMSHAGDTNLTLESESKSRTS